MDRQESGSPRIYSRQPKGCTGLFFVRGVWQDKCYFLDIGIDVVIVQINWDICTSKQPLFLRLAFCFYLAKCSCLHKCSPFLSTLCMFHIHFDIKYY